MSFEIFELPLYVSSRSIRNSSLNENLSSGKSDYVKWVDMVFSALLCWGSGSMFMSLIGWLSVRSIHSDVLLGYQGFGKDQAHPVSVIF